MSAIALYARQKPGFDERLAAALQTLRDAAAAHPGTIVQATSLGAEDMVVTDLIARHRLPIAIGTLETGALHAETVALIPRIEARYGLTVEVYRPVQEAVIEFVQHNGEQAMYQSIALRPASMRPSGSILRTPQQALRSAWVTGLRREQSNARGEVRAVEADDQGRAKINPLVDWTWNDVWHYIATHDVPYNPLHDQFMPSIGCAPCTRAIAVGQEFRAGRWWWEDESAKECGLHVSQKPAA